MNGVLKQKWKILTDKGNMKQKKQTQQNYPTGLMWLEIKNMTQAQAELR